ncbi:hypothetical protein AAVH_12856 [Aphelenchoides avenae]|nr:hypothetical protein AAVH_12856 [Aphelenchus avenae]
MASVWDVDPPEAKRKHCAEFTDKETVTLIEAYARRRGVIEGSHGPGVTQSSKRSAWDDITKEVNAVSDTAVRTVKQIKEWHHNITSVFKKYKAAVRYPPTGGGQPPARKPWFQEMEKAMDGDSRIDGVGGNDAELGAPPMAQPSQDDLFETQSAKSVNTSAASLVSTSATKREMKDAVASIGGGGSASTFATPKPAKVRRLLESDEASTKSSMQLDVIELQRKVLQQHKPCFTHINRRRCVK